MSSHSNLTRIYKPIGSLAGQKNPYLDHVIRKKTLIPPNNPLPMNYLPNLEHSHENQKFKILSKKSSLVNDKELIEMHKVRQLENLLNEKSAKLKVEYFE